MRKGTILLEHLIISGTVLFILLGIIIFFFSMARRVLTEPQRYFSAGLSPEEVQIIVIHISLIIISVLISYVVYLLLASRTRAELVALRVTKSLNLSLGQFRKLYEGAPVPYLILDEAGGIRELNKAALRFFGVMAGEVEGKNLFSFQPEEDAEKSEKFSRYYKASIPIDKEEVRIATKSGQKWALLSIFEMRGFGNSAHNGLATVFDITEHKKLDQAKTEFVSLASHQLRTPVATVKWYMDILLSGDMGELSPKQADYMNRVYKVNEEMINLIETLLNVSRIEIGSIKIDMRPTNAIELADDVLLELSPQIEEKGIVIDKQYNDNLKDIKSDPKFLRIVVQNLISNAVKYTPNKGTVTISFKDSFMEKAIIVSDTGIGIPSGEQGKVFTKLFRADNARNLSGSQGTGLGLYLVKSIMETMGGSIHFVSEENKGSTFTIKF